MATFAMPLATQNDTQREEVAIIGQSVMTATGQVLLSAHSPRRATRGSKLPLELASQFTTSTANARMRR